MRWTGGPRSGPESPANGGVPLQAGARRGPATVEVPPPADDISSAVHSRVAQLVEQPAVNRRVAGSSPASGASMTASRRPPRRRRPGPSSPGPTPGEITREQTLQQSRDLLVAITEGTGDAVFAKDLSGRY